MKLNFKYAVIVSMIFMGTIAFSQQVENPGFENWENVGSDDEEPNEWNSFFTASGGFTNFAEKTVWRDGLTRPGSSGSYSARIQTVSGPFGVVVNGNMTCGQVNMGSTTPSSSSNHNVTRTGNTPYNQVLNASPDSIVVWVNYQPNGADNGAISAIIHDNYAYQFPESGASPDHAVAYAQTTFANTNGWSRIAIPFNYDLGASTNPPEFILINLTPSAIPGGGNIGSKLYVDDLELIYNPKITTSAVSPLSYTVTNTNSDNIDIDFTVQNGPLGVGNVFTAQLSDASGNFNLPTNIGTLNSTAAGTINAVIPPGTPGGSGYRVRVIGSSPISIIGSDNGQNINIDLIGNSIAPSGTQSLLIGVDGTELSVTENPSASSREWKYSTTSGSGYLSFGSPETGVNYTPNFSSAGTYYLVCESVIAGDNIISNEVEVNVGAATITTNPVSPTEFEFSPSSPNGNISISFTTSGAFTTGNVFTTQLSDELGSFASPTSVGSLNSTTGGTISISIPNTTLTGTGYRLRVVGSNPAITGSDNGTDILVNQFENEISPLANQTLQIGQDGTVLSVMESQSILSRNWQYSTTSGSGYQNFSPVQTGVSYTPNFDAPGTYYVVCKSTNVYNDEITSEEVEITIEQGTTITTSTVFGSPINLSPSASVTIPVSFSSTASFDPSNVFTAELSDASGDFTSPVILGTLSGATIDAVDAVIPNGTVEGTGYRIRITSSNPAIVGSPCDNDIIVDQFSNEITGPGTQTIPLDNWGDELIVNESQVSNREWKFSTTTGSGYQSFSTNETLTNYFPRFNTEGTYYIVCESTNQQWNDMVTSNEVVVIVDNSIGIEENEVSQISVFSFDQTIQIESSSLNKTLNFTLYSSNGQRVLKKQISGTQNQIETNLTSGVYLFKIEIEGKIHTGKINL